MISYLLFLEIESLLRQQIVTPLCAIPEKRYFRWRRYPSVLSTPSQTVRNVFREPGHHWKISATNANLRVRSLHE